MNVPNFITLLRVLLVPILLILMINGEFGVALIFFVAAAISDGLDGLIARQWNMKTRFGAYLDPIADKLLLDTTYICLANLDFLPVWLAVLVVSRDIIILLGILVLLLTEKPIEVKPLVASKITTFLQMVTVCLFFDYSELDILLVFREPLVWATAIFTIISGLHYLLLAIKIGNPKKMSPSE